MCKIDNDGEKYPTPIYLNTGSKRREQWIEFSIFKSLRLRVLA